MGLSSLTGDQQLLMFTALGGIGLILGYLFQIIGSIGIIMATSALFLSLSVPTWRDRDDSGWSKEVMAQCYALSAFGGMAAIGFAIRMVVEILA